VYKSSKASPPRKKVMPKSKSKSDVTSRRSIETSEVQREIDDDMFEVDKSIFIVTLINFQSLIRRIINNRYFRWFHLCLELIYFTLVLFYLYFVMEIEEDNSIVLISLMVSFLIICLVIYIMNIIDHWSDIRTLIDTALIAVAIGFDIYEITLRSDDKGYENGSKFVLNASRVLRGLMLQRRASNFFVKLRNIYQSKKMKKQLKRRNSVTDMLNELLLYIGKDEKFMKKGINHAKYLIMEERRVRVKTVHDADDVSDRFGYNHHERMDEAEELDRCVYELDPDKEEYQKAFNYAKGLTDDKVSRILAQIETMKFDIFELRSATSGNELVTVINYLMDKHDFYDKLNIVKDKFRKYSIVIQSMYNPIAYHNKTHASDVCQTCYYFMTTCKFRARGQLSDLEQ
jgi:hypothetical protein